MPVTKPIYQKIRDAVEAVRERCDLSPQLGIILGSGLGGVAEELTESVVIPYKDIPHFHGTSIEGHSGKMIIGKLGGTPVVLLQGRFHYYEGYPMEEVVFPTRTLCGLGIHTLIVTNAAGGINTRYRPGDLMLIEDHLNLMGSNPLMGANIVEMGPRFPDLTEVYSRNCRDVLLQSAKENQLQIHQGVYCALTGPTYETPAEIRMLRTLGADVVGMSTVPEAIAAVHFGVRVTGISCVTNMAAGLNPTKLSHKEVLQGSEGSVARLSLLLKKAVPRLVDQVRTNQQG